MVEEAIEIVRKGVGLMQCYRDGAISIGVDQIPRGGACLWFLHPEGRTSVCSNRRNQMLSMVQCLSTSQCCCVVFGSSHGECSGYGYGLGNMADPA